MNAPSVAQFKAQFARDFPYGSTIDTVMDADITSAINAAKFNINQNLFQLETDFQFAYNYLAAHYLVTNLKASSQGVAGTYPWLESSKSVGSVSQGFTIPESILKNAELAMISKTYYGAFYLSLLLPLLRGQIISVSGFTQPY